MAEEKAPKSIEELWFRIDKRLALIEQGMKAHQTAHTLVNTTLADHEQRLRSAGTVTGIVSGGSGLLALIALVKSLLGH
jgi:hypothetical protein